MTVERGKMLALLGQRRDKTTLIRGAHDPSRRWSGDESEGGAQAAPIRRAAEGETKPSRSHCEEPDERSDNQADPAPVAARVAW